jgi:hypothetical protein
MNVDLTTVLASGLTASIIGVFQVIANRYSNRILDRLEKLLGNSKKNENGK